MNTNEQNILNNLPGLNPPEVVWENIERELDKDERRRILPYWLRYAGIAAACLTLSFLVYLSMKEDIRPSIAHHQGKFPGNEVPPKGNLQKQNDDQNQKGEQNKNGSGLSLGDTSIRIGSVWLDQAGLDGYDQNPVLTKEWGFNGPLNGRYSRQFTAADINNTVQGYINVDLNNQGQRRNYIVSDNIGYKSDPSLNSSPGALVDHNGIEIKSTWAPWVPLLGSNLPPGPIQIGSLNNGIY